MVYGCDIFYDILLVVSVALEIYILIMFVVHFISSDTNFYLKSMTIVHTLTEGLFSKRSSSYYVYVTMIG